MIPVCDVQNRKGDTGYKLSKVGVSGVERLVRVTRKNAADNPLMCTINLYVDLPAEQKGSHMSRNLEVIESIIDECSTKPVGGIEELAVSIGKMLLEKHEYATTSNVDVRSTYFRESVTPNGRKTVESYKLFGKAMCNANGNVEKTIGAQAIGMSACPCAQENVAETLHCTKDWPVITHNQRNVCTVAITTDGETYVEADDIIELINRNFSSPTFSILKRDDEAAVVINAHRNPKFVEDIARGVVDDVVKSFKDLPDSAIIVVRSESEESIHKHNAFAEKTATMGEMRKESKH